MTCRFELFENFRSFDDWKVWSGVNKYIYSGDFINKVVERIRACGVREPLTGEMFPPQKINISGDNYRETVKAGKLISRHRAILMVLERLSKNEEIGNISRKIKIYAPEALTDFALFFRGMFPRFLGTEYAETKNEVASLWPIAAEDLTNLSFGDSVFDIVVSNEIFEHVHDLNKSLHEVFRVLTPHGVLVSTFPFAFGKERGEIKAKLVDGEIEYLTVPEYHGNPMRPESGSLVFEIPGWDLIERAKALGFSDAYFSFVCSAECGVAGKDIGGIFVFVAKKNSGQTFRDVSPRVSKSNGISEDAGDCEKNFSFQKSDNDLGSAVRDHVVTRLAGLVGLPRSGTTVFAAAIGANPAVKSVFEPWNAEKKCLPPINLGLKDFCKRFDVHFSDNHRILLVKETAADPAYLEAIDSLLSDRAVDHSKLIWIFRNPIHTFLSEVNARKIWWGEPDLRITEDLFSRWADRSLRSIKIISNMCARQKVLCVDYDFFVTNPEQTLRPVMKFLGEEFSSNQIDYFKSIGELDVRGDVNVASDPKKISTDSMLQREIESESVVGQISGSIYFDEIMKVHNAALESISGRKPTGSSTKKFVEMLSALL